MPTAFDPDAIVSRLRATDTVTEGATYLTEHNLDREGLLAVASAAGLTRVERLSMKGLKERILQQTIAARRKFAGLRNW